MLKTTAQAVRTSLKALLANKGRSFLTMLGIIIGVAAVIIIMAVGAGAQSLILSQVKSLGSNLVGVLPGKSDNQGPPAAVMGVVITTLKYEDLLALEDKKNAPNLVAAVGYTKDFSTVSWGAESYDTNLSGSTVGYLEVEGGEVAEGRFFTKDEEKNLAKVAVLGSTVREELFGQTDPIGKRIKIKKHLFEIIGIMKPRGTVAFQNYDDQIFLPLVTTQKLLAGRDYLGLIRAKVDSEENIPLAISDIETTLRERHGITDQSGLNDDFTVLNAAQALDILTTITNGLKYFLAAVAALSLLVGGIGIMNIMLVSVRERTREIGLRKAVGATNLKIRTQFLFEAIIITFLGGCFGIVIGTAFSYLIAIGAHLLGYTWDFIISIVSILLGVGVSVFIGLVFGLYPAVKASKLNPIEALRYE